MRQLASHPDLPNEAAELLAQAQAAVQSAADPDSAAEAQWRKTRSAQWFRQGPLAVLRGMAGPGEPCMFCDAGEGNEVDHYLPRTAFPEHLFSWENFLLVCGVCNQTKGNRHQDPDTGALLLNPTRDAVWGHLQMDEFGLLLGVSGEATGSLDERGEATIRIVKLNREALRHRRRCRIRELCAWARDLADQLARNSTTRDVARQEVEEKLASPFQPDVAQYFLRGPGRDDEPFRSLLARLGQTP